MPATPVHGLRYPTLTDPANGPVAFQNLAEDVANTLPTHTTSATRPPHSRGRIIYEHDTGRTYMSDGVAWLPLLTSAASGQTGSVTRLWSNVVNANFANNPFVYVAVNWASAGFKSPPNPTATPVAGGGSYGQIEGHFANVTTTGATLVALAGGNISVTIPFAINVMGN